MIKNSKFVFNIDAALSKLELPPANPANSANQEDMISNFSNISSYAVENEKTEALIDTLLFQYNLKLSVVKESLGNDWVTLKKDWGTLEAIFSAISDIKTRERGEIPAAYTDTTICKDCGEIPIPPSMRCDGYVLGCPWCFNKTNGLPIPKPVQIRRRSENDEI